MRLIPAWAGKTSGVSSTRAIFRAHPRVGGENLSSVALVGRHVGSSPRGRGKPPDRKAHTHAPRLIPAWAGKTRRRAACRA